VIRDVAQLMHRQIEDPDVRLPAPTRHECKGLAVGRERALVIKRAIIGESLELRSIRMYPI
jgi:hypothetical protein